MTKFVVLAAAASAAVASAATGAGLEFFWDANYDNSGAHSSDSNFRVDLNIHRQKSIEHSIDVCILGGCVTAGHRGKSRWYKRVSSVRIDPAEGARVVLYEKRDYRGATLELTESIAYLGDKGWNDKMGSFKVYFNPPPPLAVTGGDPVGCARVFLEKNFGSNTRRFYGNASVGNLGETGFDNQISSLVVGEGFIATLCPDEECQIDGDDSLQLAGAWPDLSAFDIPYPSLDNKISSFRIDSNRPRLGCARVFTEENFEGVTAEFCGYSYNLDYDGWSDVISSVIASPGCGIGFYDLVSFGGRSLYYGPRGGGEPNIIPSFIGSNSLNNKVSSMRLVC